MIECKIDTDSNTYIVGASGSVVTITTDICLVCLSISEALSDDEKDCFFGNLGRIFTDRNSPMFQSLDELGGVMNGSSRKNL